MKTIFTFGFFILAITASAQVKTIALGKGNTTADTYLHGSFKADPTALVKTKWFKAYGFGASIVSPDSVGTKVTSLHRGTYRYGFIVTDVVHNLADTDYVKIIVK